MNTQVGLHCMYLLAPVCSSWLHPVCMFPAHLRQMWECFVDRVMFDEPVGQIQPQGQRWIFCHRFFSAQRCQFTSIRQR